MTQRYSLMTTKIVEDGPLEPDYTLMTVTADDAGLIIELVPTRFREADARGIEIRQGWADLAQTTIDEFRTYLADTYEQAYTLVRHELQTEV